MLTSSFFAANRRRLVESLRAPGLIVLSAHRRMQRSGDTTYPFRQNSSFFYFTGIEEPDVILVIDTGRGEEWLILPELSEAERIFDGSIDTSGLKKISGINSLEQGRSGWQKLSRRAKAAGAVQTIVPPVFKDLTLRNAAQAQLREWLRDRRIKVRDVSKTIVGLRAIKQPAEIGCIEKAVAITVDTLSDIFGRLGEFGHEYELEAALTAGFRVRGARGHAYDPIVASGRNACTLHYTRNGAKLSRDDLLLIDAGAEVSNYASDITRTVALDRPTARQRAVHAAVLALQEEAIARLRPGITLIELDRLAHEDTGRALRGLGLAQQPTKSAVRRYFPHSISHFMGLDVHDVGYARQPLRPGMVLTVEPGIYINREGIGVRIEDDILITENGARNLSASLSADLLP